ncbi:phosphorylase family protein [Streptomyces daliensis]|uniref:1-hydroxy-2-methyl-2-butenyl 4-diphosphate reductase n=1 Tax=Streptomyces daliensis TaxID=299421 RepID=A0A8T4IQ72_9ACTN|nr:1-hydroxy-2-methyl-2-butenyl 4-diphosphate reductase [Streptomyces daliensis]
MGAARGPVPEGAPDVRGAPGASGAPGSASPEPLLVACALGIERLALRGAAQRAGAAVTLLRTGMGPQAAGAAVAAALRGEPVPGRTAVVATGFCAGLVPGMHPGDLVVADATRAAPDTSGASNGPDSSGGSTACTGTAALAAALEGLGTVHTGLLAGSGHVVRGAAREELRAATGAVAVDMESAATLAAASAVPAGPGGPGRGRPGGPAASRASPASLAPAESVAPVAPAPAGARPLAAVRVVVDAPGHELVRIGTLRGGISAFRVLHGVLPAFLEWHRSLLLPWR